MSLGLGDLKRKAKTPSAKASKPAEKFPSGAWAKSETARPWSADGLQKGARNRKRTYVSDAVMTEEWSTTHVEALLPLEADPSMTGRLQESLLILEEKIRAASERPLWLIRNLLPYQK
jgi:hypothetical protein